ncbi:hypothetical protein V1289_008131 [Bradyrhizobium sp. AZCC 2289]
MSSLGASLSQQIKALVIATLLRASGATRLPNNCNAMGGRFTRPASPESPGRGPESQSGGTSLASISSRSCAKSIGLVNNPLAPLAIALRLVSGSP